MIKLYKKLFSVSDAGAKDLIKASWTRAAVYIWQMLPVAMLVMVLDQSIISLYSGVRPTLDVWLYVVIGAAMITLLFVLNYWQYNKTFLASYNESASKRITLAEKLRTLPLSFFGQRDLSDLTTTIMSDVSGLEHSFSHFIPSLAGSIISTVFVCVGMVAYEWRMGLALVWVIPVSVLLLVISKKHQDSYGRKTKQVKLEYADGIQECIENIRDIRANNRSIHYIDVMDSKAARFEKSSVKTELTSVLYLTLAQMLLRIGVATTMLAGAYLLISGQISLLTLLCFLMASVRVFEPVANAFVDLTALYSTMLQIDRMRETENYPIQTGREDVKFDGYDISFNNVTFDYHNGKAVLDDVSFTAKQGEVTALVGPSGSGKSTAAKLAARFWDVNDGSITIGGKNISMIEPETLLKQFSIVFQDVTLFNNTVLENIRIGKKGASDEEVYEAAHAAQCDEFIIRLPGGYKTMIGENGALLSGGERQRISIARAMLKDAPIILLDEATASLDVDNETAIQSAISQLIHKKTVLVIAHRLRTVAGADKIVVLENGSVVEQGTHCSLIRNNGVYKRITEFQTKSAEWGL